MFTEVATINIRSVIHRTYRSNYYFPKPNICFGPVIRQFVKVFEILHVEYSTEFWFPDSIKITYTTVDAGHKNTDVRLYLI